MEQLIQRLLLRCAVALAVIGLSLLALGTAGGFAVAGIYDQFYRVLGPASAAWATAGVLVLVVLVLILALALVLRRRRPLPVAAPTAAAAPADPLFTSLIGLLPARPRDRLILAVAAGALLGASSELRALLIAGLMRGRGRPPAPPPL